MTAPQKIYDRIVTADAVRAMREETCVGMMTCKRRLEKKAMRQILVQSDCSPGVRFILIKLIEDMYP